MEQQYQQIHVRAIIEVLGKPKEYVEKAIREYLEKIRQDKNFSVVLADVADTQPQEDGLFVTFAELELKMKNMPVLMGFCFDYMPSVIEILEPEKLVLADTDLTKFINDLQARLHQVDMVAKQAVTESGFLKKNLHNLMKNYVTVILANAGALTSEQLSKLTGMAKDSLEDFLDTLVDEKVIKMEGETYLLAEQEQEAQQSEEKRDGSETQG